MISKDKPLINFNQEREWGGILERLLHTMPWREIWLTVARLPLWAMSSPPHHWAVPVDSFPPRRQSRQKRGTLERQIILLGVGKWLILFQEKTGDLYHSHTHFSETPVFFSDIKYTLAVTRWPVTYISCDSCAHRRYDLPSSFNTLISLIFHDKSSNVNLSCLSKNHFLFLVGWINSIFYVWS